MNVIEAKDTAVINLGYAGEKDRTLVRFYYGDVASEFPGGFVSLQVRRPCETDLYLVALSTSEDGYALWTVGDYDTEVKGLGECQLIYSTGDEVCKKKVWRTSVDRSLEGAVVGIPPDWESAINQLYTSAGELSEQLEALREEISNTHAEISEAAELIERASQVANKAGYMSLQIDDWGHLIYTRSEDVNVDFELDENGHLLLTNV